MAHRAPRIPPQLAGRRLRHDASEGLRNQGYFSSNRGDAKGWDHIYSFVNPEIVQTVKGWVYEQEGYELPQAVVYMVGNDGTNLKLSVKGDGSFTQQIRPGVDYVLLGTCKGFLNHKEQLRVEPVTESQEYVLQFPLASITAPVLIDNIFYDFDKATLRPESTQALDELIKLLNENPNVTIELSAHCDYRGAIEYNRTLSQKRAESVVSYLVEHGIAADRLSPVGYGKEKPKTIRKKLTETYTLPKRGRRAHRRLHKGPQARRTGDMQPAQPPHGVHRAAHHLRDVRRARQPQEPAAAQDRGAGSPRRARMDAVVATAVHQPLRTQAVSDAKTGRFAMQNGLRCFFLHASSPQNLTIATTQSAKTHHTTLPAQTAEQLRNTASKRGFMRELCSSLRRKMPAHPAGDM